MNLKKRGGGTYVLQLISTRKLLSLVRRLAGGQLSGLLCYRELPLDLALLSVFVGRDRSPCHRLAASALD